MVASPHGGPMLHVTSCGSERSLFCNTAWRNSINLTFHEQMGSVKAFQLRSQVSIGGRHFRSRRGKEILKDLSLTKEISGGGGRWTPDGSRKWKPSRFAFPQCLLTLATAIMSGTSLPVAQFKNNLLLYIFFLLTHEDPARAPRLPATNSAPPRGAI